MSVIFEAWNGKADSLRYEIVKTVTEFVGTYANVYDRMTLISALKSVKQPNKIRDYIITDLKHPRNKKYIYQIWKIYNDFDREKKLDKLF